MSFFEMLWLAKSKWICVLICYVIVSLPACADDMQTKRLPLVQVVTIQNGGNLLDINVSISEENLYAFGLRFMFKKGDEQDYARVRKLIGGFEKDLSNKLLNVGEPLMLSLRVEKAGSNGSKIIFDQLLKVHEIEVGSWGGQFHERVGGTPTFGGAVSCCAEHTSKCAGLFRNGCQVFGNRRI